MIQAPTAHTMQLIIQSSASSTTTPALDGKEGSQIPLQKGADWGLLVGNIYRALVVVLNSRSYRIIYNETFICLAEMQGRHQNGLMSRSEDPKRELVPF